MTYEEKILKTFEDAAKVKILVYKDKVAKEEAEKAKRKIEKYTRKAGKEALEKALAKLAAYRDMELGKAHINAISAILSGEHIQVDRN